MSVLTLVAEQALAPVPGGTGRYARQIGGALAERAPSGWSVRSVTAWHVDVDRARIPGVDGPHRFPAGRRALTALWERGWPPWPAGDSIHATTPLAPARRRAPLVATVHDTVPWTHPETLTPRGVAWHRGMIARLAKTADAIVVPSSAVATQLEHLLHLGDRLEVIPHGVTALPLPDDPDEFARRRRRLGLPEEYLLSVSTLEPRKGLDVLLAAMENPALEAAQLVVVGQPGWGDVRVPAGDRVHLLGRVDDTDLAVALHGAAVVVVPSRAEGFGLPVLEAMAAGKPVVHSDIEVLREVAGDTGIAVPVGDAESLAAATAGLLGDPVLREELGRSAQSRARGFSWNSAADQLWAVHQRVR